jgi:hypothetical protein
MNRSVSVQLLLNKLIEGQRKAGPFREKAQRLHGQLSYSIAIFITVPGFR